MGLFAPTIRRGQAKPYTSVPRIDWTHPLAKGLTVYAFDLGGAYIDLVGGQLGTNHSTSGRGVYKQGQGLKFPTTGWVNLPTSKGATNLAATLPYSIACATNYVGAPNGTVGSIIVGNAAADNSTDGGIAFTTAASGGIAGAFNNGANQVAFTTALANNGTYQSWVIVPTAATTANYYANGTLDKSATGLGSTTFSIVAKTGQVMFNTCTNNAVTFGGGINGYVPYFAAWNRQLTAHEARMLHDSPYDFLIWPEEEVDAIEVGSTGLVNKTLSAGAGSYSLTGTAATLKVARINTASAGSYALTGTAATLRRAFKVSAVAGSYSLTGTAATLTHKWILSAGAGSYALTGTDAALKHAYPLIAGSGSYSLTGTAATLLHKWVVSAGAGSYALTGTAATLRHGYAVGAGAGSYALTGSAATLTHKWVLSAGSGSYALTGTDATLTKTASNSLSAGAGSYALTGSDATLLHKWIATVGAGSYALTGTNATLTVTHRLTAGAGSYTLTGTDANLVRVGAIILDAGAGSYTLSGSVVTLQAGAAPILGGGGLPYSGSSRKKRKAQQAEIRAARAEAKAAKRKQEAGPERLAEIPPQPEGPSIAAMLNHQRRRDQNRLKQQEAAIALLLLLP